MKFLNKCLDNKVSKRFKSIRMKTTPKSKIIFNPPKISLNKKHLLDALFREELNNLFEEFDFFNKKVNEKRYTRDEFTYSLIHFQIMMKKVLDLYQELNDKYLKTPFKREQKFLRKLQCFLTIKIFKFYQTGYGVLLLQTLPLLREEIDNKRLEFIKEIRLGSFSGISGEEELKNILSF